MYFYLFSRILKHSKNINFGLGKIWDGRSGEVSRVLRSHRFSVFPHVSKYVVQRRNEQHPRSAWRILRPEESIDRQKDEEMGPVYISQ